jgi:hypothetical protein
VTKELIVRLEIIIQKNHSGSRSQLGLIGGAQPIYFFLNPRKTSIQLLLEAQQHKKYAQTTRLDDEVSSLFSSQSSPDSKCINHTIKVKYENHKNKKEEFFLLIFHE